MKFQTFVILIILIFSIFSCARKKENIIAKSNNDSIYKSLDNLQLNSKLKEILIKYLSIRKKTSTSIYVYIDKISTEKTNITLSNKINIAVSSNCKPLFFTKIENDTVYLYTGLEDYFNTKTDIIKPDNDFSDGFYWTIEDSLNNFKIHEYGSPPFTQYEEIRSYIGTTKRNINRK